MERVCSLKVCLTGGSAGSPFLNDSHYFASSTASYMVNLIADNLHQTLAQIVAEIQAEDDGGFGWFIDSQGNKVELWQPKECVM